jgi:hypothetical protein
MAYWPSAYLSLLLYILRCLVTKETFRVASFRMQFVLQLSSLHVNVMCII